MDRRLIYLLFVLLYLILVGLYDSPWAMFNRSNDLNVDPEYLSGILSASGILFGIWAILIQKKPKEITRAISSTKELGEKEFKAMLEKVAYEKIIFPYFLTALGFLIVSVIVVCLTGLNLFSSAWALFFCTFSFIVNAIFLTFTLRYLIDVMDILR
jgi:uncharacterized membrane protein YjgN (DUF898 family)